MKKNNFQTTWIGLLMLCIFGLSMQAQNGNVTLGSGTTTSGDGTGTSPVNGAYRNFRYQTIYTKAEIIAAGGAAGNITQIGWRVSSSIASLTNYTIRMGHTSSTTLSSHIATTTNQVYTAATYSPAGSSVNYSMLTLNTPFTWDGNSNIVVEVCYSRATTTTSGGGVYTYAATSPGCRYIGNSTTTTLCTTATNLTGFSTKPQIRFVMPLAASTCTAPSDLESSNVTGTTATISWDAVAEAASGYETYYSTSATASTAAGTATTSLSRSLTSLTAGTTYHFWVRSKCSATSFSDWTKSSFVTPCIAPTVSNAVASAPACMSGSVNLTANASAGTLYWFDAATGGNLMGTGTNFQTPVLNATTNYHVAAGQSLASDVAATIGSGASTSSGFLVGQTPFYVYGSQKTQYIIKASELFAAGIGAGSISSLAIDVTSVGNASLSAFSISLGSTTQNIATNTFIGSLSTVYSSSAQAVTAGINTYAFSSNYVWNGTSNLVVQICWNNGNAGTTVNNVKFDNTDFVSQTNLWTVSSSASVSCSTMAGSGTASMRPKFIINGKGICMSASRQTVSAVVKTNGKNFYDDLDNDGYGNPLTGVFLCEDTVAGKVTDNTDCDDANINVNPGEDEILYDGIDNNCDGELDEGNKLTTKLFRTSCGTTLAAIGSVILIQPVSDQPITGYKIRVTNGSHAQTLYKTVPRFTLLEFPQHDYATTYTIDIELERNGILLGYYGESCLVSTPAVLEESSSTGISPTQCGETLPSIKSLIYTKSLNGATGYRFKVTDITPGVTNGSVQTVDRPTHWFSMQMLGSYTYNATYMVEVAVKTTGAYLNYGASCTIMTPQVGLQNCDETASLVTSQVRAMSVNGATQYRFQISRLPNLDQAITLDRPSGYFNFTMVPGFTPGAQYFVRVAVMTANTWSVLGEGCEITAPGVLVAEKMSTTNNETAFAASASPNPFVGSYNLKVTASKTEAVQLRVYDMLGKLVENRDVNAAELENLYLGDEYPTGVYNIVINQGENHKTLRVIKK